MVEAIQETSNLCQNKYRQLINKDKYEITFSKNVKQDHMNHVINQIQIKGVDKFLRCLGIPTNQ